MDDECKVGDDKHIQGFILNKLIEHGCWVKPGGQPGRHHSITNITKGYLKSHRGNFNKQLKVLNRRGLIHMFPHGDELHVCAVLDNDVLKEILPICNAFRRAEGLPEFGHDLREML